MPIYEYACEHCRKIFQFFFRSAASRRRPACPKCGRKGLTRRFSRFSTGASRKRETMDAESAGMDRAIERLTREMGSVDEDDPRQLGRLMRKVVEETGQEVPPELRTAIDRLEAGEDPKRIEEEMGDLLDGGGAGGEYGYDDTLYEG